MITPFHRLCTLFLFSPLVSGEWGTCWPHGARPHLAARGRGDSLYGSAPRLSPRCSPVIDLRTPLSLRTSFAFPLQTAQSRRGRPRIPARVGDRRAALGLSFLGLLALGVGFLVTSVWFWQVAGFSFARVFSQKHGLG